ncbi:phosphoenolpyruvate synthase [Candidatus Woesebacteria bacterium RIFCSPHIGHO2_02_FULL_42_20]|uniref:Phosphoenolpyruvate synthase n=1 Tax=Candidatus Woesebacteria bacterium RIFCSPHIGHO2_12_FULL_41_24 TaxID=1802510 RepID=A0A1F8AQ62_9BACT|nr:MAG: phosphoenolpyruvate synthase [Candidatus Woesebacteria bacterium RIFCSPHIGHO2_01_FULL_42_80]OGM35844.1 MAG: phosphoenolpyruvate synthase [Candidatus Woesebacteria bacterium RIFCSPHIGHO2_02_FULL_42_20]OGM53902.1 MAG: phosphoenolpyruvate synthase [Candidatus Woesebacteria bacterium RIFCSPHIGHO2_12_FULL_41_24]OGM66094.1 MAG: phosphoenolpyruvate synthase [Candidatus Woesebacteria bacterium RIFCSPLOWO2_01_FULL_42_67]OGM70473.1 MAG: phosphoenolpyruvate synthase [Candidatus Woesebacteria bacte
MTAPKIVEEFSRLGKSDTEIVGGKGANLGEMTKAGFPVPPGFCVTVTAYDMFLAENDISEGIYQILGKINVENTDELTSATASIQRLIKSSPVPKEVAHEVVKHYKKLSGVFQHALVAVRSSATAEDMPGTSFAGQQATFLNVKGEANLMEAVRGCWASLFTARSVYYRVQNKIPHTKVKIAVVVQKMVQSQVSGVMFTVDPVTNAKDRIVIEAVWGLGEYIVQGAVIPDHFVVQKDTYDILSKEISNQKVQLIRVGTDTKEQAVPSAKIDLQKITDAEVVKLAKYAQALQKHYYYPQDIEWAKETGKLYIVQTRPITTLSQKSKTESQKFGGGEVKTSTTPILTGAGASPGIATGVVRIVKNPKEINKVASGDILVAPMTSPDFVPAMKKAMGIVTDEGGQTSHAAIVSRELGVPCVVGTKEATKKLKDGDVVTVDGRAGYVYAGAEIKTELSQKKQDFKKYESLKTATKLYINLAEVERAKELAKLNVEGVGLLRAEFMIANIGLHPKEAIKNKKRDHFVAKLAKDIEVFCKSFYPRPVVYRSTDFKTNEYKSLPGGAKWEPDESNPMLGYRGAFRYIADPEVFTLELDAIKAVREKYNNLWLMIPFVRSPEELLRVRRIVASNGLFESSSFKFWMMVEIPVNVISIEDFIKVGIDGVSIGANDLTMLVTGTDRDNADVASAFNERSKAVIWSIKRTIKHCLDQGVTCSICGQAPSVYDDLVETLVKTGITSISVNPDAVGRVRKVISQTEREIIKG